MQYFNDIKFVRAAHLAGYRCHLTNVTPSCYTLEYIAAGNMYYKVDHGPKIILDKPALHWHCKKHVYNYGPVDAAGWDHYFVNFSGKRAARIYEMGIAKLSDKSYCLVHNPAKFEHLFLKLVSHIEDESIQSHSLAVVALEEILSLAFISVTEQVYGKQRERILDLAGQIADKPMAFKTLDQIAQTANLSRPHLCRLFKQVTGRSAYDYMLHCRMRYAANLLRSGKKSTGEISRECGYDDIAQFTKMFQKKIGISPGRYRKMISTTSTLDNIM
ncbi:MAG: helix-turn-helix transcriptional regulator [Sedimentisphaerales bacterium]|nr:helix-turn-helix transcriptional regulator [Sedimentisphaerales bacterium]